MKKNIWADRGEQDQNEGYENETMLQSIISLACILTMAVVFCAALIFATRMVEETFPNLCAQRHADYFTSPQFRGKQ